MQYRSNQTRLSRHCFDADEPPSGTSRDVATNRRVSVAAPDGWSFASSTQRASNGRDAFRDSARGRSIPCAFAHELSQPLAAVITSIDTSLHALRKDPADIIAAIAAVEHAARAGARAARIIHGTRNLLAQRALRSEPFNLTEIVNTVLGLLHPDILLSGATVTTDLAPTVGSVVSDSTAVEQIITNLLNNALDAVTDALPHQRHIHVRIDQTDDDFVRLSIRDSGPGISNAAMRMIFEPFFTTKRDGTGLGLTISLIAAEASGGRITARNHPRGGAEFALILPTTTS